MGNSGRFISNRLRKHRLLMGYTQKQLADFVEVHDRKIVSKWEQGLAMPSGEHLLRLAKALHVSSDVLYQEFMIPFEEELAVKEASLLKAKQ